MLTSLLYIIVIVKPFPAYMYMYKQNVPQIVEKGKQFQTKTFEL